MVYAFNNTGKILSHFKKENIFQLHLLLVIIWIESKKMNIKKNLQTFEYI